MRLSKFFGLILLSFFVCAIGGRRGRKTFKNKKKNKLNKRLLLGDELVYHPGLGEFMSVRDYEKVGPHTRSGSCDDLVYHPVLKKVVSKRDYMVATGSCYTRGWRKRRALMKDRPYEYANTIKSDICIGSFLAVFLTSPVIMIYYFAETG